MNGALVANWSYTLDTSDEREMYDANKHAVSDLYLPY
jgi:hypothetical protein